MTSRIVDFKDVGDLLSEADKGFATIRLETCHLNQSASLQKGYLKGVAVYEWATKWERGGIDPNWLRIERSEGDWLWILVVCKLVFPDLHSRVHQTIDPWTRTKVGL